MDNVSRNVTLGMMAVIAIGFLLLAGQLFEVNHAGYVQVKQAAGSGDMSVRTDPGMYSKMFATITQYTISDVYDFHDEAEHVELRFNDAATAKVSGQIRYRLPNDPVQVLRLHQDFRSDDGVHKQLVKQVVENAIRQTSSLFSAEEVYSLRRADFVALINDQIKDGLYATTYQEIMTKDEDGNTSIKRTMSIQKDKNGNPIIAEESLFKRYGIELLQVKIDDPKFDDKTNELIAERKKADQQKVVAKANAERAKQDAITAEEVGKANVATAEASALVEKKKAVVDAQREKEVAEQQALQADAKKRAEIAIGEGEAAAAALKVKAGLTPLDKANIDKETAIGVAHELAQVRLPQLMVMGGGGQGGNVNPFDAVGLEALIKISKDMTAPVVSK